MVTRRYTRRALLRGLGVATPTLLAGCGGSLLPDGMQTETARLLPGDAAALDKVGSDVALAGATALVGASGDWTGDGQRSASGHGSATVFRRTGGEWRERETVTAPDSGREDRFGTAVALASGLGVVGAPFEGSENAGQAYAFERSDAEWGPPTSLSDGTIETGLLGRAVALSGDTAVVGADGTGDPGSGLDRGAVIFWDRTATGWRRRAHATTETKYQRLGAAVAVDGDIAIVGAPGTEDQRGTVSVFSRAETDWTRDTTLTPRGGAVGTSFGHAVSLTDETALVGEFRPGNGDDSIGVVHVFDRTAEGWTRIDRLTPKSDANGGSFGRDVALSDGTALVGSSFRDTPGASEAGAVAVFGRTSDGWTRQATLVASDRTSRDFFGSTVALSGRTALVGASASDTAGERSGAAYVFDLDESE
jgi:hypothetical protein